MHVNGILRFVDPPSTLEGATAVVRLLDTSRADAASRTIAEVTLSDLAAGTGETVEVPFTIEAPELEPRASYTLAAHVDVSGTGEVASGDFITMQAVPVAADEDDKEFTLSLRLVR